MTTDTAGEITTQDGCTACPTVSTTTVTITGVFLFPEDSLRGSWGVSRIVLREKRRQCARGVDWEVLGKVVHWSREGVLRIAGILELGPEKLADFIPPDQASAVEVMTVASSPMLHDGRHFANRGLIRARRGNNEIVTVKVSCPGRFLPRLADGRPMTFAAQKTQWGWEQVGRSPRWVGRW